MATEQTIERCFDRVRTVFTKYLAPVEYADLRDEWVHQLHDYAEAAVLDATEALVLGESFPTMLQVLSAVQAAARAIREEQQFVWGRQHPEVTEVDPVGMKRLVQLIREQFSFRSAAELEHLPHQRAQRRDITMGHDHARGAKLCPICAKHDHSDGRVYCEACAFDDEGIQLGDPNKLLYLCREKCDPVSHLVTVWVDEHNVPLPDGVMGKTDAVYPCPRCRPDDHDAWRQGKWGGQGGKPKAKSKRVNASALDDD